MKKILLSFLMVLSLFIVGCGKKDVYEKAYFDETLNHYIFQLDDYEAALATNDDVVILEVTGLGREKFRFLDKEAIKYHYNLINGVGKHPNNDGRSFLELHKMKF